MVTRKKPAKRKKFIVYSISRGDNEVLVDIVMAVDKEAAAKKVAEVRSYAMVYPRNVDELHEAVTHLLACQAHGPRWIDREWARVKSH